MNKKREMYGVKVFVSNETYNEYKGTLQEQLEEYQKALDETTSEKMDLQKEIERLNNVIDLIRNNIDITIQIIKEQQTGNDEWILERLNGIKNIGKELKEGK